MITKAAIVTSMSKLKAKSLGYDLSLGTCSMHLAEAKQVGSGQCLSGVPPWNQLYSALSSVTDEKVKHKLEVCIS